MERRVSVRLPCVRTAFPGSLSRDRPSADRLAQVPPGLVGGALAAPSFPWDSGELRAGQECARAGLLGEISFPESR